MIRRTTCIPTMKNNRRPALPLFLEFLRFNLVGLVNTGVAYLVFSAVILSGGGHRLALAADYTVGLVLGFLLNKRFTFRVKERATPAMFIRMIAVYALILAFNFFILEYAVRRLDPSPPVLLLLQFFILFIIALAAYAAQKLIVFRKSEHDQPE